MHMETRNVCCQIGFAVAFNSPLHLLLRAFSHENVVLLMQKYLAKRLSLDCSPDVSGEMMPHARAAKMGDGKPHPGQTVNFLSKGSKAIDQRVLNSSSD